MLKAIEKVATVLAYIAGGILLIMMVVTTIDVAGRYLFNAPLPGALELGELMLATIVALGFAYVQVRGAQISVTVLSSRLPPRGQDWANLVYSFIGAGVMGLIVWQLTRRTIRSFAEQAAHGLIEIPLGPVHSLFALGYAMLVLVLIVNCVASAVKLTQPSRAE